MAAKRLASTVDYVSLLEKYDTWMFDCDGVLWEGDVPVPGAVDVLAFLRAKGKRILFVTNNPTRSRKDLKEKFDQMGVDAHVDEIFSSAYASAVYISSVMKLPKDKKVYVLGMSGIEEELREEGIAFLGVGILQNPADNTLAPFSLSTYVHDPSVAAVLCSSDTSLNYTKLSKAFQYLTRNPGCAFFASDEDTTYPIDSGFQLGSAATSAPLRYALGRPPLSFGKPASTMLDGIKAKHGLDPARTLMIGDRLNTDILFGINGGLATLLVLTGVTQEADIAPGPGASPIVPDYVTQSIGDLRVLLSGEGVI